MEFVPKEELKEQMKRPLRYPVDSWVEEVRSRPNRALKLTQGEEYTIQTESLRRYIDRYLADNNIQDVITHVNRERFGEVVFVWFTEEDDG